MLVSSCLSLRIAAAAASVGDAVNVTAPTAIGVCVSLFICGLVSFLSSETTTPMDWTDLFGYSGWRKSGW